MNIKIIKLKNQGFCYGVTRAIDIAVKSTNNPSLPRPIYLLGNIVHNDHISLLLDSLNIITIEGNNRLEMLDKVQNGATVIFSAHGVSDKVRLKAKAKNLTIVDAICPYVEKTFGLIADEVDKGNEIFYIGKKNHPETEAATELSNHVHVVDNELLEAKLPYNNIKIANQTTMSRYDINETLKDIKNVYPEAELLDMVCKVTENRQKELADTLNNLPSSNTLTIIVGDKKSNNSTKLYELAQRSPNTEAVFVESIEDLSFNNIKKYNTIVIASGTSTPMALINEIEENIKNIDNIKEDRIKSSITINDLKNN